ncbi:MAG: histone deacetylase [bacterium]|nr:MAG: histone deacetylase [bacterium]
MIRIFRKIPCKLVYRSEYMTGIHAQNTHRSFDVMRFKKIRDQLIREKLIRHSHILKAPRITDEDLLLVHTREYLNSLRNPLTVGKILNLDYVNPWDEYILEYFRYVSGGTLLATEYALEHKTAVFNLGGGYHHAHPDRGEGFCLINDVAIAIRKMQALQKLNRSLIVDLDYHQGNGNLLYFQNDENIFTFSMHADNWNEVSNKTHNIDIELPAHTQDKLYLDVLTKELPGVFSIFSPDLVFYIAGSDPYIQDSLGDFDLTEKGMLERDKFVYQQIRKHEIPLVILGAGGYGPESWKIYFNFIKWVIKEG